MTQSLVSRVVKVVNIAIAVLLAAGLALVYWYVWRPLPQRSGAIDAPLAAGATVNFDTHGEPHIRAASLEDAFFVQGYVTAQDRLWQMDALRRFAGGTLAEILGPRLLESDRESRKLRMRRIAEDAYVTLPAADRAAFAAYTRGVNHFIATHLQQSAGGIHAARLPAAALERGGLPAAVPAHVSQPDHHVEGRNRQEQPAGAGRPRQGGVPVPDARPGGCQPGLQRLGHRGQPHGVGQAAALERHAPGVFAARHLVHDAPGGARPRTSRASRCRARRASSWGTISASPGASPICTSTCRTSTSRSSTSAPAATSSAARWSRRASNARSSASRARPHVEMTTWVTRHGPIFLAEGKQRLALRWTAAEPGMLQYPFIDIDRAQNWRAVHRPRSRGCPGPGSNFVYADVDGNIGYHAAGALPRRRNYRGDVPVDGSSGNFEWDGYIPFDELPSVYNPPSGHDRHRQPEYVSRELSLPGERQLRAAVPRSCRFARCSPRTNGWRADGHADGAEGHLLGVQPFPGGPDWWPRTRSATRTIPAWTTPWPCCATGTARWIRTWPRRS